MPNNFSAGGRSLTDRWTPVSSVDIAMPDPSLHDLWLGGRHHDRVGGEAETMATYISITDIGIALCLSIILKCWFSSLSRLPVLLSSHPYLLAEIYILFIILVLQM